MSTNEELIQAAKLLKENCNKTHCTECVFYDKSNCGCTLHTGTNPLGWELPKPRRWTDADIQLAKALKAFGVKSVYKKEDEHGTYALNRNSGSELALPDSAFASLREEGETVSIDSILKEAEE